MVAVPVTGTFADRVARLHRDVERLGLSVSDMRRADPLELQMVGLSDNSQVGRLVDIERLETTPIEARMVPALPTSASRIRAFLDGSQRSFLVWRCGLVPVAATVAAAAVLVRDPAGRCEVAPGTLRLAHALFIPRRSSEPRVNDLVERVLATGMTVIDPLDHLVDEAEYAAALGDYGRMVEFAYRAARNVREQLESDLLRGWTGDPRRTADDGWIVVDGRLRVAAPRAIGLVKQFTDRHLAGAEAETLLNLAPGHRTTAFCPSDNFRGLGADRTVDDEAGATDRTLWYLRLWDAAGLDARHALIRIEAGPDLRDSDRIDELSAWLMAERTPRATADARWATLLYPVHYLERILKRRLEADTRGWPAG